MSGQPGRLAVVIAYLRRNALGTGLELVVNFALPCVIFSYAKPKFGDVHALMISSAPPILWSIVEFVRRRRVDALSIIVLLGIALSLAGYFGGGGVKFLQLRERLVTAAIGLVFLGSVLIGRPLIYYLALAGMRRRGSHQEADDMASRRELPMFKQTMMIMTLVWGFGLVIEAAIAATLVFFVPIKTFFLINPIIGYSIAGLLTAWTWWFARRRIRAGEAMRAAAAEADAAKSASGEATAA
jgi:hypothetical protein